ncbi:hypothetical protein HDV00_003013 [Rhizophlyctis rosea]|nr:hypothetical protein HDV00_003013 [Rhizophlyctis rosea]
MDSKHAEAFGTGQTLLSIPSTSEKTRASFSGERTVIPPSFDSFKTQYATTEQDTPAAVVIDYCVHMGSGEAHLGLLARFSALESPNQTDDFQFLCQAEIRYISWLTYLKDKRPDPDNIPLPPLDVAYMWHAHMLNPLRYYEDTYHLFGMADVPYYMPLERMHSLPGIGYHPDADSIKAWESYSSQPFTINPTTDVPVTCLWCTVTISVPITQYMEFRMKEGTLNCTCCDQTFSAATSSLKRLITDLTSFQNQHSIFAKHKLPYPKGSILDERTGTINTAKAKLDIESVFCSTDPRASAHYATLLADPTTADSDVWKTFEKNLKALMIKLRVANGVSRVRKSTLSKVGRAYRDLVTPLTIDLVAAVIRQRNFTTKMISGVVPWTDRAVLARSTIRYRQFLLLMDRHKANFLVPTLDIDLMWHTHQLHPLRYQQYGIKHFARIIDHDDAVGESKLNDAFFKTCLLWKKEFRDAPPARATSLPVVTTWASVSDMEWLLAVEVSVLLVGPWLPVGLAVVVGLVAEELDVEEGVAVAVAVEADVVVGVAVVGAVVNGLWKAPLCGIFNEQIWVQPKLNLQMSIPSNRTSMSTPKEPTTTDDFTISDRPPSPKTPPHPPAKRKPSTTQPTTPTRTKKPKTDVASTSHTLTPTDIQIIASYTQSDTTSWPEDKSRLVEALAHKHNNNAKEIHREYNDLTGMSLKQITNKLTVLKRQGKV